MATYTEIQKKRILSTPIADFLAHIGKRTDHKGELYFSPFRNEENPSFHISQQKNVWMDFGTGEGGNLLQLAQQLLGLSAPQAWDYLAALPTVVNTIPAATDNYRIEHGSKIVIRSTGEILSSKLIRYAKSRGISADMLKRYCKQVVYRTGSNPEIYTCIGFANCKGGWVLRSASEGPYSKITSISTPSFIGFIGMQVDAPSHGHVEIFEGLFDFMSWLVLNHREEPGCDVCVLNSVNNLSTAMEFISRHQSISCWLDDDPAGRNAWAELSQKFPKSSHHFAELESNSCKDVNELLQKQRG